MMNHSRLNCLDVEWVAAPTILVFFFVSFITFVVILRIGG
jgi:hypothetical protein